MKLNKRLSHLDGEGGVRMVDVGGKEVTRRVARAEAVVSMNPSTLEAILEDRVKKGNVLTTAKIAGILAAKRVGELVPLCHTLAVEWVELSFEPV